MLPYNQEDIVAIATPPGVGALAVVRISGGSLKQLYKNFTHKAPKNRFASFSRLYHPKNNIVLDEAVVTFFESPNSFTGEDVIEISCHGGEAVKNSVVHAALDCGVRLAEPGEFTFRSFLNGKIDLIQAEAVSALISSKTPLSSEISLDHLGGRVSLLLVDIKTKIINVLSIIENELNFSEEEIDFTSYSELKSKIKAVQSQITKLLNSSVFGKNIFSGIRIIIYGKPNSGKSSLFNAILGHNRAITSSVPGTTRDTIEAWFELAGVPVCLIDTAGIWEPEEHLDGLGVEKTLSELEHADICLLVDEKDPESLLGAKFNKKFKHHYIFVKTKLDLNLSQHSEQKDIISTSSTNNVGIKKLLTCLSTYICENINTHDRSSVVLITQRQRKLLADAGLCLEEAIVQLDAGVETDVIASTLQGFVVSIKDVVGEIPNKDVLQNIFSTFCVGK